MEQPTFSSPMIAREMQNKYGSSAKVVKVDMRHVAEVKKYVMKIETAHKDAAKSNFVWKMRGCRK